MEKNNIAKQFFTTISPIEYGQRLFISINLSSMLTHLHPWFGKETGEGEDEVEEEEGGRQGYKGRRQNENISKEWKNVDYQKNL